MKVTECAVISSRTRESAESIGHSINTMLSRFSRLTETGFNEDDDTKINDVAKALNTVGISLTDQQGNFRNFGTIMDEINGKWSKLDDQTKSYIANTVAGTRQQSRFFNLMNGYAESMTLYEKSLDAAGTAQSKFNLHLESNQATLDKFRTTLEGLWTTIIDSDSLMSIVKGATSFIEVLDSMVQKFGTLQSALAIIIPLVGVKLAWAFRTAYVDVVKLIATGASKEILATGGIFTKWAVSLTSVGAAAKGATIGMTGLTVATAGLTLGIGLLAYGVMKWAQKSREAKEAFANALDSSQKLNDEVRSLEDLARKQEELTKIENKSVDQKEELIKVQRELVKLYPQLATGIDNEGNKIADNLEMTKQLTEEKRKLLEQELLVVKTTADTKLPQLRKELADMQDEAKQIQDRLISGDTTGVRYNRDGMARQVDETQELKDRLLELVNAQKEHHEEITKLENGVKSYNQILEENAERQKWATVEELKNQAAKAQSAQELEAVERKLKSLGFTSEDTANIISGNIDLVKEKYKELDMQQIINLQTIENLDATQKQAMMSMLESSKQATKQLIEDTKARIKAIMAEAQALVALTGGKVKNATVISKKQEIDPKNGLLSALATKAQNEAIDAQRELVNLEGNLKDIEKALANVSAIDTKQISGTRDPDKKKKKEEYKAEADRYAKINLELDRNNILLQRNKTLQDLAGDDIAKKLTLMEEQIELEKEHQNLLHQKANIYRKEMVELEKTLGKQGFKFAGEGDNRVITNLDNIKGKTKEVEEQFKRYIDIQSKEIPSLQQMWMDLKKAIESTGVSIKELQKKELSDRLANSKDWIEKRKFYDDWGSDNEIAAWERVRAYIEDYYRKGIISHKEYTDYILDIDKSLLSAHQKLEQDRISALDNVQEKIVAMIRKRGEEEKKALDENHKAEMESLEERHKERKESYQKELEAFKSMIQGKIDALDEQYEEEDYLEQLNKEREEANRLQREIDVLSLDDSLTARNKTIELRKQLADQNDKITKMQQKKERDTLKKSLQDQLKDKEKDMKDKEKIADNLYENEKKRLEENYRINKEFLDKRYSDESVYAEAKTTLANKSFDDIYNAYVKFEDKFGKGMGHLGEIIKNDFIKQLELAKQAIDNFDSTGSFGGSSSTQNNNTGNQQSKARPSEFMNWSDSDYAQYIQNKKDWEKAKSDKEKDDLAMKNAYLRTKYWDPSRRYEDKYHWTQLVNWKGYAEGGKNTVTGLHMLHGTKTDPEWIFNDKQLKDTISNITLSTIKAVTPKVSGVTTRQGITLQIDNFIKADTITKDSIPELKKIQVNAMEDLKNLLIKNGVRPSLI